DPGAGANDLCEGDLTAEVTASGAVDAGAPDSYAILYDVANAVGLEASTTRTVEVVDTTPPEIACPASVEVAARGPSGGPADFAAPGAHDVCDPSPAATCARDPGSPFPIGSTTVPCAAVDAAGQTATCSFAVTVTVGVIGLGPPLGALVREGQGVPPLPSRRAGTALPLELIMTAGGAPLGAADLAQAGLAPPPL